MNCFSGVVTTCVVCVVAKLMCILLRISWVFRLEIDVCFLLKLMWVFSWNWCVFYWNWCEFFFRLELMCDFVGILLKDLVLKCMSSMCMLMGFCWGIVVKIDVWLCWEFYACFGWKLLKSWNLSHPDFRSGWNDTKE